VRRPQLGISDQERRVLLESYRELTSQPAPTDSLAGVPG
jgi:hypothetical protein